MNKKLVLTSLILVLVLGLGTFFVLNTLMPYVPEQIKVGETAELDGVLNGSVQPAPPVGTPTIIGTTEELKPAAETPAEPAADTAPADAAEPAPAEPAADAATTEPAAPEPAPAAEVAAAEPAPAPEPEPAAAPTPAPVAAAKPAPAASKPAPIKPWWSGDLDGELSVNYVGSLANKKAIVVMFNGAFKDTRSLAQHAKVNGGKAPGSWEISPNNSRMAIYSVGKPGRYQLTLASGLTDASGKAMKKTQQGPVDVN